jgi:phage tail-like protein
MAVAALAISGGVLAQGKEGKQTVAYNWRIEIDGIAASSLTEISGLESSIEFYQGEGGTRVVYKNITLTRELNNDTSLYEWYKKVVNGQTERKSGSIIYLDRQGNEVARFMFFGAMPIRYAIVGGDGLIKEEIEFVVEKVERK